MSCRNHVHILRRYGGRRAEGNTVKGMSEFESDPIVSGSTPTSDAGFGPVAGTESNAMNGAENATRDDAAASLLSDMGMSRGSGAQGAALGGTSDVDTGSANDTSRTTSSDSPADPMAALRPIQEFPETAKPSVEKTLQDPLLRSPRKSSVILCIVFGALFLLAAAGAWWASVRTVAGQQYDDLVWETLQNSFPKVLMPIVYFFAHSTYVIGVIVVIGIVSVLMVVIRRRWLLLIQLTGFALASFLMGFALKRLLPRPVLDPSLANPANTSPSGHSVAAFAAAAVLMMAVPLSARAVASVIAFVFATSVGFSVVVEQWHRPSDVIVAFLMVTGLALFTLAFTRASGMDKAGARRSSASIQITSTVFIVAGVCVSLYACYLAWQVIPGLGQEAAWTLSATNGSAALAIAGVCAFSMGILLAMRQITASPLSAIGLVGAPPAPPAPVSAEDSAPVSTAVSTSAVKAPHSSTTLDSAANVA